MHFLCVLFNSNCSVHLQYNSSTTPVTQDGSDLHSRDARHNHTPCSRRRTPRSDHPRCAQLARRRGEQHRVLARAERSGKRAQGAQKVGGMEVRPQRDGDTIAVQIYSDAVGVLHARKSNSHRHRSIEEVCTCAFTSYILAVPSTLRAESRLV